MKHNRINVRVRTDLVLAMAKMKEMGQVYKRFDELVSACAKAVNYPSLKPHHLTVLIRSYPEFKCLYHSHVVARTAGKRDAEMVFSRLSDVERRLDDLTNRVSKIVQHITKKEIPSGIEH